MTDLARQANRLRIFGKQCIRDNEEFKRTPADKDSELFVLRMLYEQECKRNEQLREENKTLTIALENMIDYYEG